MTSASETSVESSFLILAALTAVISVTGVSSLRCYQCTVTPSNLYNDTKRLCTHFDASELYAVDCPYSTMCVKQDISLRVRDGVQINAVSRDCAAQRHDFQVYADGGWSPRTEVLEPYEEGCREVDDKGARTSPARYCYCRGNLCNAAPSSNKESFHTDAMAVIVVFNLLKYIRSLR